MQEEVSNIVVLFHHKIMAKNHLISADNHVLHEHVKWIKIKNHKKDIYKIIEKIKYLMASKKQKEHIHEV